ncbi:MAG: GPR endopeptidase [Thermoanaerobacteraceae bacterium]|nr:GPR endopeptidase [Thermoanaerobacteraceae bacterium]
MGVQLDLAVEAQEVLRGDTQREIPGVKEKKEDYEYCSVTTVSIVDEQGVAALNKPQGNYITIEAPQLRHIDNRVQQEVSRVIAEKLELMLKNFNLTEDALVLLVGLGNWDATPDALGPRVIDQCLVTRHLHKYAPDAVKGGLRPVAALSPGVLGITGIETAEIIKGVVEKTQPNIVIAVDSLAARAVERISTTVQLADTGINPGSGIGNQRKGLNHQTLGVPVIAIGVPTVVHAAVFAFEAFNKIMEAHPNLRTAMNQQMVETGVSEVLKPFEGNLTVTPKEIDDLIDRISKTIALGVNQGLHPGVGQEEALAFLQ